MPAFVHSLASSSIRQMLGARSRPRGSSSMRSTRSASRRRRRPLSATPCLGTWLARAPAASLESFGEVIRRHPGGRMLVSTVDAWCVEADFVRFVEAAARRPVDATVLAVTPLVADEKPLRVVMTADGRVQEIGGAAGDLVTAGMYLVAESVRALTPPAGLGRLRDFLQWLARSGAPLYGEIIEQVVDVDRADDVALAETLALAGRVS